MRSIRIAIFLTMTVSLALGADTPRISLETLQRSSPGWTMVDQTGDATSGSAMAERIIWPMFYLHWRPLDPVGRSVNLEEAEKVAAGLWPELALDAHPPGRKITLPAHEGILIEATTGRGERRNRYIIWACPQSERLLIADTSVNLSVTAPQEILDWQGDMARTVECHRGAAVDKFPHLPKRYEVPHGEISYSHPATWAPVAGYLVQEKFADYVFAPTRSASTPKQGQDLTLAADAAKRLFLSWGPAPDAPLSYDAVREQAEQHWQTRANNLMWMGTRVSNDVWIADGIVQQGTLDSIPPGRHHKFRAWAWRRSGTAYFAVGQLQGVKVGRRLMSGALTQDEWEMHLEEMFQSIVY